MQAVSSAMSAWLVLALTWAAGLATSGQAVAAGLVAVIWLCLPQRQKASKATILVDGSNVLHWLGDPDIRTLRLVLEDLGAQGHRPKIIFDANVGYIVSDRYLPPGPLSRLLDVDADMVEVVDRGRTADEALLGQSDGGRLRIVTRDRYRDWAERFPHVEDGNTLLRGRIHAGAVRWDGNAPSRKDLTA